MVESKLVEYPIEREEFCRILARFFNEDWTFINGLCIDGYESERFKCWYDDKDFWMLDKECCILVTWYKHHGRSLRANITKKEDFDNFMEKLVNDIKEIDPLLFGDMNDPNDKRRIDPSLIEVDPNQAHQKILKNSIYGMFGI